MADAQIAALARSLNAHGVRCVVIGGLASELHGASVPRSEDMDVCALRAAEDDENLGRIIAFLTDVGARPDRWPTEVPYRHTIAELRAAGRFVTYDTDLGPFDISFAPSAFETDGYHRLVANATRMDVGGEPLLVASLEDVIASK